jgi:hypothetical protein
MISHPPMLMPGKVAQIFSAGLVVDQADDEGPHGRTPLFDRDTDSRGLFPGTFVQWEKRFPACFFNTGSGH